MSDLITLDTVKDTAQAVVAKFGHDHTNPLVNDDSCVYTDPEGNHCIAAQILVELKQPCPAWGDQTNGSSVNVVLDSDTFTTEAIDFMASLQETADEGGTWGNALEWALDNDIEIPDAD